jgi:hypothetical protein
MCGDPAWKDLMDDVREMLEATNTLDSVDSEKMLWFRKGEVSMMKWMLSIKDVSDDAYNQLKDDDETAA